MCAIGLDCNINLKYCQLNAKIQICKIIKKKNNRKNTLKKKPKIKKKLVNCK